MGMERHADRDVLAIRAQVARLGYWHHNIDLCGVMTNPDMGDHPAARWRILEPQVPADLSGKTVLDVGCNAGFFAVQCKQRGAERVLGIDVFPDAIEQARFAADVIGVDIEYRLENVYDFVLTNRERFDHVLFLGLFYHLRHPLLVLDKLAEATRERLFFQTVIRGRGKGSSPAPDYRLTEEDVFDRPEYPRMAFIEDRFNGDPTNWWLINEPCAWAALRSAGLRDLVQLSPDTWVGTGPGATQVDYDQFGNVIGRVPTFARAIPASGP